MAHTVDDGLARSIERLRDALAPFVDIKAQMPQSVKLIQKEMGGFTPITLTVTKAQMLAAHRAYTDSAPHPPEAGQ